MKDGKVRPGPRDRGSAKRCRYECTRPFSGPRIHSQAIRIILQASVVLGSFGSHSFGATTNSLVVPPDRAETFGNTSFGIVSGQPLFYQVLYNPTNFAQVRGNAMLITGIAFRIDESPDTLSITIPRVEVWASTFTRGTKPTRFPEQNWGSDRTEVFRGENLHFEGVPELDHPDHFQIQLPFTKPFVYDPASGGLLLDFQTFGPFGPRDSAFTDADARGDGSVFTVFHFFGGEYIVGAQGDVMQIHYAHVPKLTILPKEERQILISFLATAADSYVLQEAEKIGGIWSQVESIPAGTERTVTIPIERTGQSRFFRLQIPSTLGIGLACLPRC